MQLPRHLSYTRSLSPSKAVFFYKTLESAFEPLQIEQNKLVGQKGLAMRIKSKMWLKI